MFSLYSKKCEHVLRGLAQIGRNSELLRFRASDFCYERDLPESFTRKALQSLVRAGILNAIQGPGGGYSFARPVADISVLEIILAIEGDAHFSACVMGFDECHAAQPCGLHALWVPMKGRLLKKLDQESLGSLMRVTQKREHLRKRRRRAS
jgi:Rrf2 family protein